MMQKKIIHTLHGREKHITETEVVIQSLPHQDFRFANPLIVLHHLGPVSLPPGAESRIHPHPHRGFSPVTFLLQGEGYHRDNAGHDAKIREGDVQWMFAGKGILHSEGATSSFLAQGGPYELLQLWVNVPKANKWQEPFYQIARKNELPRVSDLPGVNLRLASGEYAGKTGPLSSFTPVTSIVGEIRKGVDFTFQVRPGDWTLLYIARGVLTPAGGGSVPLHTLLVFEKPGDEVSFRVEEDATILFLSAEPLDEPLAVRDNFVMNTPEEITQAILDVQNGKFGSLDF